MPLDYRSISQSIWLGQNRRNVSDAFKKPWCNWPGPQCSWVRLSTLTLKSQRSWYRDIYREDRVSISFNGGKDCELSILFAQYIFTFISLAARSSSIYSRVPNAPSHHHKHKTNQYHLSTFQYHPFPALEILYRSMCRRMISIVSLRTGFRLDVGWTGIDFKWEWDGACNLHGNMIYFRWRASQVHRSRVRVKSESWY